MPNSRTSVPGQVETAWPWKAGRFAEAESQDARGGPGSRDIGPLARPREKHGAEAYTGVNPLPPIDPAMPNLHPGDQGG
jgi:hypothetical protein